jgi:hypothetical protein
MDELKQLIELLTKAAADLERLRSLVAEFGRFASQTASVEELRKAARTVVTRLDEGHAAIGASLEESLELTKRLAEQPTGEPTGAIAATDLAKGFRSVIQTMQREVAETGVEGVGTVIRNMEVELKGLIVVEDDEPRVVPPAPRQEIDPGQLSTIRMSFASVPLASVARPPEGPSPGVAPESPEPESPGPRPRRPG